MTSFCASTRPASLGAWPDWGRCGVSGYYARGEDEVAALCQMKLANFATVVVFTRADLEAGGIDVIGTFRTPHVTLAGGRHRGIGDGPHQVPTPGS